MSDRWDKLPEEHREAVRQLLEDSVNMAGPWGLPNDIIERGMHEREWLEALDAGLEQLASQQNRMDDLQARLDRIEP